MVTRVTMLHPRVLTLQKSDMPDASNEPPSVATTVHANWLHEGAVSCLSFATHPSLPFLATGGLTDRMVYVLDTRPASQSPPTSALGSNSFRAVAFVKLPGTHYWGTETTILPSRESVHALKKGRAHVACVPRLRQRQFFSLALLSQ